MARQQIVFRTTSVDVITLVWPTGDGDADCQAQAEVLPNMPSVTTYYVNCSLMLSVCNLWQFRHDLFLVVFSIYSVYSFSCLLTNNICTMYLIVPTLLSTKK